MNDGSEVVTIIRIGMETQYYLIKGVVKSILQLIQFMKKMEKTGILKGKEMNNFNAFIKKTEGQFQLLNIPTEQPEELEGMGNLDGCLFNIPLSGWWSRRLFHSQVYCGFTGNSDH